MLRGLFKDTQCFQRDEFEIYWSRKVKNFHYLFDDLIHTPIICWKLYQEKAKNGREQISPILECFVPNRAICLFDILADSVKQEYFKFCEEIALDKCAKTSE